MAISKLSFTVQPRFNEVSGDYGNGFVLSKTSLYKLQIVEKQSKCSLYQCIVNNCFLTMLRCTTQHFWI